MHDELTQLPNRTPVPDPIEQLPAGKRHQRNPVPAVASVQEHPLSPSPVSEHGGADATPSAVSCSCSSSSAKSEEPSAAERRLARVRFDLHDGPQQDLMLLAEDLRLFRSQLESVLSRDANHGRLLRRIDDLEARLVALDGDLRRICVSTESPFLRGETLPGAARQLIAAFAERTEIQPEVTFDGDFTQLSDSQHITLLGLIRESLSNVREHSDARHVTINLCSTEKGVEATITDDGCGFDPEVALVRAARTGHLGIVGMHERVRMLGGEARIDSRPGGPTVISVRLAPAPVTAKRRQQ